jgi:hypothetical protein
LVNTDLRGVPDAFWSWTFAFDRANVPSLFFTVPLMVKYAAVATQVAGAGEG